MSRIIDNIGASPEKLAHFLDLSHSTVRRYIHDGQAPRPVMLALFWETSWGVGASDCHTINKIRSLSTETMILKRQIEIRDQRIALTEAERAGFAAGTNNTD